ncbi:MAG: hypothetical protein KKD44_24855 [Proteobacteria bacterium]|nr:hypothetical protein [Pseudomonadota bacterium]
MNKLSTIISSVLFFLGAAFFVLIVYVSILGDNHKIDFLVTHFFEDLKTRNYTMVCQSLPGDKNIAPGGIGDCQDFCFFLELSFLSKFNLLDQNDYSIAIKRDHFWIPYITADQVWVSIAFTKKKKNIVQTFLHRTDDDGFIKDFMLVERRMGQWEIKEIRLDNSSLAPLFNELKAQMDLDRYILKTERGFILKDNEIDPSSLSTLERRLLEFSLFKLSGK